MYTSMYMAFSMRLDAWNYWNGFAWTLEAFRENQLLGWPPRFEGSLIYICFKKINEKHACIC